MNIAQHRTRGIAEAKPSSGMFPDTPLRRPQMGELEALDSSDRAHAARKRPHRSGAVAARAGATEGADRSGRHAVSQPRSPDMAAPGIRFAWTRPCVNA